MSELSQSLPDLATEGARIAASAENIAHHFASFKYSETFETKKHLPKLIDQ